MASKKRSRKPKKKRVLLRDLLKKRLIQIGAGPYTWARVSWEYDRIREKQGIKVEKYRGVYVAGSLRMGYLRKELNYAIETRSGTGPGLYFNLEKLAQDKPRPSWSYTSVKWDSLDDQNKERYRLQALARQLYKKHESRDWGRPWTTRAYDLRGADLFEDVQSDAVWKNSIPGAPHFRVEPISGTLACDIYDTIQEMEKTVRDVWLGYRQVDRDSLTSSFDVSGQFGFHAARAVLSGSRELARLYVETDVVQYASDVILAAPFLRDLVQRPTVPRQSDELIWLADLVIIALAQAKGFYSPALKMAIDDMLVGTLTVKDLRKDDQNRLHCEDGPARGNEYWIHGVRVPAVVVLAPENLRFQQIMSWPNVEVRRVALERMPKENLFDEQHLVQKDSYGELYSADVGDDREGPMTMVKVINSTPEPDGTFRIYWLRVPPTTKTAHQAVAWTFNIDTEQYNPSIQT